MNSLKRTLGLPMLCFYGTQMIVGAGIYSIIGKAAAQTGETLWLGFSSGNLRILKRMNLVEQDESGHDGIANNNTDGDDLLATFPDKKSSGTSQTTSMSSLN